MSKTKIAKAPRSRKPVAKPTQKTALERARSQRRHASAYVDHMRRQLVLTIGGLGALEDNVPANRILSVLPQIREELAGLERAAVRLHTLEAIVNADAGPFKE
jgi:hypothetical protein